MQPIGARGGQQPVLVLGGGVRPGGHLIGLLVGQLSPRTAWSVLGCLANRLLVANFRRAERLLVPVLRATSSSGDLAPLRFHAPDSSYRAVNRVTAPDARRCMATTASNTAGTS